MIKCLTSPEFWDPPECTSTVVQLWMVGGGFDTEKEFETFKLLIITVLNPV
jgi:hypothetical protein